MAQHPHLHAVEELARVEGLAKQAGQVAHQAAYDAELARAEASGLGRLVRDAQADLKLEIGDVKAKLDGISSQLDQQRTSQAERDKKLDNRFAILNQMYTVAIGKASGARQMAVALDSRVSITEHRQQEWTNRMDASIVAGASRNDEDGKAFRKELRAKLLDRVAKVISVPVVLALIGVLATFAQRCGG